MLRQAFQIYLVSLHPRNLKKVPKERQPSWFLMIYWVVIAPMMLNKSEGLENYFMVVLDNIIKFFPILLMLWSNLLGKIFMPKAMFLAPMQKEERKQYINNIILIKIGIPILLGILLEIIRGFFFEINLLRSAVIIFIQFSFGIGCYICNTYPIDRYCRSINLGVKDKNGNPKTAWLNVFNMGIGIALLVSFEITDFTTNMTFFDGFLFVFLLGLLVIFDILIIKTQYRSMIEDSCDFELSFGI